MDSSSQWSELRSPSVLIVLVCLCGARLELEKHFDSNDAGSTTFNSSTSLESE